MTLPETLYTKDVDNETRFLLVTYRASFDIRLDRYEFLKSDFAAEQILDRLLYRRLIRFLGHKMSESCWVLDR
jgi:hypothetical protein